MGGVVSWSLAGNYDKTTSNSQTDVSLITHTLFFSPPPRTDDKARYPESQAEFFERAGANLARRESLLAFIGIFGAGGVVAAESVLTKAWKVNGAGNVSHYHQKHTHKKKKQSLTTEYSKIKPGPARGLGAADGSS